MPCTSPYPTAEACCSLALDINRVMRPVAAARRQGAAGTLQVGRRIDWTTAGDDAPWAEMDILVEAQPDYADAVLRFAIDHVSRPTGPQVQRLAVVGERCHLVGYGGTGSARQALST